MERKEFGVMLDLQHKLYFRADEDETFHGRVFQLVAWSTDAVVYQTRYGDLLVSFRDNRYVRS
jgi:hypothetical protein